MSTWGLDKCLLQESISIGRVRLGPTSCSGYLPLSGSSPQLGLDPAPELPTFHGCELVAHLERHCIGASVLAGNAILL
jgi:hypothetical protein